MSRVYFATILLLIGYLAEGALIQDSSVILGFGVRAANSVKTLCLKNADEKTSEEALEKLTNIIEKCWDLKFLRSSQNDEEITRLCVEHRQNMIHCLNQFSEKFQPCLGSEEEYFNQLISESYGNYSNFLCDHILELIPERMDMPSLNCLKNVFGKPEIDPSKVCYENSEVFGSTSPDDILTKPKLCRDLQKSHACYRETFEEHCPDATLHKNLVSELLKNALLPCQDVLNNEAAEISENNLES